MSVTPWQNCKSICLGHVESWEDICDEPTLTPQNLQIIILKALSVIGGEAATICKTSSECGYDECCMMVIPLRGKRATDYGYCTPNGRDKQKCYINNAFSANGRHANSCPCGNGYQCVSSGYREIPQGEVGQCTAVQQKGKRQDPVNKGCSSGKDCGMDECCVSRVRPLGKRFFLGSTNSGVCTKLGTKGSGCLVKMESKRPLTQVFQCPCSTGYFCKSSHQFDIPLGEMGVCTA
ncbi:hypothetical protein LOTGIDRAFT_152809 [Lottia gigantea]|uniref:Prokineticin domain-containing protein n=1 Tax=Lottia gigantea TaxID=225164 RepID=V4AV51_LOTGI|nr:hypothetical protein LOTGIDRAFT_152809 [Lottia gigantea]ESO97716.1 hypothetical protein LOTGIDRAFT_152809 [Lottia gigantea]